MNRFAAICFIIIFLLLSLSSQESADDYADNISRLETLGFNYFPTPVPLTAGTLFDSEGRSYLVNGSTGQILLIVFLTRDNPFTADLRSKLNFLSEHFENRPFKILAVSSAEEDFKDREGRSGDKWGVMHYPTILLVDHNFNLRGSCEGLYPDLSSDDFLKVVDELLLDIKSPGIINTLE